MTRFTFESKNEAATDQLGQTLEKLLPDGTVVALCGTLGAGKTRLVQAIAEAGGIDRRDVISPTFVLLRHYQGRRMIHHFDAYRIADDDEFLELGPEEYFDSPGITFVEWADRVKNCLPPDTLEIRIEVTGESSRQFEIRGTSERFDVLLEELKTWATE